MEEGRSPPLKNVSCKFCIIVLLIFWLERKVCKKFEEKSALTLTNKSKENYSNQSQTAYVSFNYLGNQFDESPDQSR